MPATSSTDPIPIAAMSAMIPIHLNPTNFLAWKRQVLPIMEAFELLEFIDGFTIKPSLTITAADGTISPNPAYAAWQKKKKKDQKLISVLFSTLTEEAISEVVDCTTSSAVMVSSWRGHLTLPFRGLINSGEQLLSLRHDSLSIEEYRRKFKPLCGLLTAIGRSIKESDKLYWFLWVLGLQFIGFADTHMSMDPVPSFRNILHQAIQFDIMFRSMEGNL